MGSFLMVLLRGKEKTNRQTNKRTNKQTNKNIRKLSGRICPMLAMFLNVSSACVQQLPIRTPLSGKFWYTDPMLAVETNIAAGVSTFPRFPPFVTFFLAKWQRLHKLSQTIGYWIQMASIEQKNRILKQSDDSPGEALCCFTGSPYWHNIIVAVQLCL